MSRRIILNSRPPKIDAGHQIKLLVEGLIELSESVDSFLIYFWMIATFGFTLRITRINKFIELINIKESSPGSVESTSIQTLISMEIL